MDKGCLYKNEGKYKIGYTMLEVDGVPGEWIHQCNCMDEIWVPSVQCRYVPPQRGKVPIRIMPLGVDPNYFHPGIRSARFSDRFTFLSVFEWGERKIRRICSAPSPTFSLMTMSCSYAKS